MEYYRCPKRMDLIIGSKTTMNSSLNGLGASTSTSSSAAKAVFGSQSDTPSQKVIRKQFSRSRERLGQSLTGNDGIGKFISNDQSRKNFNGMNYHNEAVVASTQSYEVPHCSAQNENTSEPNAIKNITIHYNSRLNNTKNAQDQDIFQSNLNYTSNHQQFQQQRSTEISTTAINQQRILQNLAGNSSQALEISQHNQISLIYNRNDQPLSNLINQVDNLQSHKTIINSNITSNLSVDLNLNKNSINNRKGIPLSISKATLNNGQVDITSNVKISTLNPDEIEQRLSTTTINNIKDIRDSNQYSKIKRSNSITLNHHNNQAGFAKNTQLISSASISASTQAANSIKFFENTENIQRNNHSQQFYVNFKNSKNNNNNNNGFFDIQRNLNTCPGYSDLNCNYEGKELTEKHDLHQTEQQLGSKTDQIDQLTHNYDYKNNNQSQGIFNYNTNSTAKQPPTTCGCARNIAELKVALSDMRKTFILSEQKQLQLEEENRLLWRNIHQLEAELQQQPSNIENKENMNNIAAGDTRQREKIMKTNKKLQKRNAEMEEVIKQVLLQQELHKQRERTRHHNKTTLPTNNCSVSQISENNSQGLLQSSQSSLFAGTSEITSPNISKAAGSEPKPQRPRNNSEEISCNPGLLKKLTDQRKIPEILSVIINGNNQYQTTAEKHDQFDNDDEEYHQYFDSEKQVLSGKDSFQGNESEIQQKKLEMKERLILSKIHEVPSFANFQSN